MTCVGVVLVILVDFALLETGLRVAPGIVPLDLLREFQPELKHAIADRLGLPNEARMIEIPRDDGGPRLLVPAPHSNKRMLPWLRSVLQVGDLTGNADENGFCNAPSSHVPRTADIVVLGDSFVWCNSWRWV